MQFEDRSLAPYRGDEPYVFISYSHRDAEAAAEIIRCLNQDGFRVWYDEGLVPGREWDEHIANAIVSCSYLIALVSANYLRSANCRDELNYARDKMLPLLLIYLENVTLPAGMDLRLGRIMAIHAHKIQNKEALLEKIRSADGISVCRNAPDGETPDGALRAETQPAVQHAQPQHAVRSRKPLIAGGAFLLAAVIALLLFLPGRGSGSAAATAPPGIVTEAPESPVATDLPAEESPALLEETPQAVEVSPTPSPTETPVLPAETPTAAGNAENDARHAEALYRIGQFYLNSNGAEPDYETAILYLEQAAEQGSSSACFSLGELHYNGTGVEQDYEKALAYYMQAAEGGSGEAMQRIGHMYYYGQGVEQDTARAKLWWREAEKTLGQTLILPE